MTERSPLSEEEQTDLTAYLDGELDEEAARVMEARINLDPRLRAEAESLRSAWDMLDYLPRPEPSPSFTHRTLELVSAARVSQHKPLRRWKPWAVAAAWAAGVFLAGLVGYAGTRAWLSQYPSDEDLIRDLHIIENKRQYEPVSDIEFLHRLSHPDFFGDESTDS
jgi:anti-sigma factor RsiW